METENKEIEAVEEVDEGKVKALIEKIEMREITLSFSSIREFMESPRHFIAYKLKEFNPTPDVIFGDLVDCLFTDEKSFDRRFVVITSKCALNSIEGCNAWLDVLGHNGVRPTGLNGMKLLIKMLKAEEKRHFISPETLAKAKAIVTKMRLNGPFMRTLEDVTEFQRKVEFDLYGWKWIGYEDMFAEGMFVADLKKCPDTKERKVKNKIKDEKLILQLALYCHGEQLPEGRLLFFDAKGHFRAERIREADLRHQITLLEGVIEKLEDCIHLEQWHQSRDFWSPNWDGLFDY
jgi:hypothetical protein